MPTNPRRNLLTGCYGMRWFPERTRAWPFRVPYRWSVDSVRLPPYYCSSLRVCESQWVISFCAYNNQSRFLTICIQISKSCWRMSHTTARWQINSIMRVPWVDAISSSQKRVRANSNITACWKPIFSNSTYVHDLSTVSPFWYLTPQMRFLANTIEAVALFAPVLFGYPMNRTWLKRANNGRWIGDAFLHDVYPHIWALWVRNRQTSGHPATSFLPLYMSSDDDDECVAVQLDGTGMYPRAQKVSIYSSLVSM